MNNNRAQKRETLCLVWLGTISTLFVCSYSQPKHPGGCDTYHNGIITHFMPDFTQDSDIKVIVHKGVSCRT